MDDDESKWIKTTPPKIKKNSGTNKWYIELEVSSKKETRKKGSQIRTKGGYDSHVEAERDKSILRYHYEAGIARWPTIQQRRENEDKFDDEILLRFNIFMSSSGSKAEKIPIKSKEAKHR